ncbi:hypothetical protein [Kineosporia babensis]|uniref:Uncharacterized protein n=1 Tax=Kineosporia babensis TaxID=499548 RepID=A0A9X1NMR5_9ACTN|nr:hypothetical protein [Kineosporia babensis]MCD5317235.1 hypothetical protein [Kineosporia babensis]
MPEWKNWLYDLTINAAANVIVAVSAYGIARWAGVVPNVGGLDVAAVTVGSFLAGILVLGLLFLDSKLSHQWGTARLRISAVLVLVLLVIVAYQARGDVLMVALTCAAFGLFGMSELIRRERKRLVAKRLARRRRIARHHPVRSRTTGPRPRSLRRS